MGEAGTAVRHPCVGWREWVSLPELGVRWIKAKVDTGARSSALHVFDIRPSRGRTRVRFSVHPVQRSAARATSAEAEVLDRREVRSSSGVVETRYVVRTLVELFGRRWPIELTLASRDAMGFRMLLGREALRRRFLVDPGRSFLAGKPPRPTGRPTRGVHR